MNSRTYADSTRAYVAECIGKPPVKTSRKLLSSWSPFRPTKWIHLAEWARFGYSGPFKLSSIYSLIVLGKDQERAKIGQGWGRRKKGKWERCRGTRYTKIYYTNKKRAWLFLKLRRFKTATPRTGKKFWRKKTHSREMSRCRVKHSKPRCRLLNFRPLSRYGQSL